MPQACVIRAFDPADAAALCELHRSTIMATAETYTLEERESWATGMTPEAYPVAAGERVEVALGADGQPIGFCGWRPGLDPTADEAEVVTLVVTPGEAGAELAARLLARAEEAIRAAGASRALSTVSLASEPLFASAGYRALATVFYCTRGGVEIAVRRMEKALD